MSSAPTMPKRGRKEYDSESESSADSASELDAASSNDEYFSESDSADERPAKKSKKKQAKKCWGQCSACQKWRLVPQVKLCFFLLKILFTFPPTSLTKKTVGMGEIGLGWATYCVRGCCQWRERVDVSYLRG